MSSNFLNINSSVNSVFATLSGRAIRKLSLLTIALFFAVSGLFGQSNGDFRTAGNVNFASATNWERYNGGWGPAVAAPVVGDGIITIRPGNTATLTASATLDQIVIASGGALTINSGQTLTLNNGVGTDLDVSGTVNNSGIINPVGSISFNASSAYNHTQDGGTVPAATWNASSDCNITGITGSSSLSGLEGQTFGNFNWNCPLQASNLYMESNFTVAGNFRVAGTGAFDHTVHSLRMSNTGSGYLITVAGNFIVENTSSFKLINGTGSSTLNINGDLLISSGNFTIGTGVNNAFVNVNGNVNVSGGTLCLKEDANAYTGALSLKGNFSFSAGTISQIDGGGGIGSIIFNGTTPQVYSKTGGTFLNTINFTVNTGAILNLGTGIIDGSTGTFTVNAGGGIMTAHPQGLSTTAGTGNIQVTGGMVFNPAADYYFNASVNQLTGNAVSAAGNLTINNSGAPGNNILTLSNDITCSGVLTMTSGNINTNPHLLSLASSSAGSLIYNSGIITGRLQRAVNAPLGTNYLFPVGTASNYRPAVFNFSNLASATNIIAEFISASPGAFVPYTDGPSSVDYVLNDGYWSFSSTTAPAAVYSLSLDGKGFAGPIDANTRISGRMAGSTQWQGFGTHGNYIPATTVTRTALNNLNTTFFDYCLAQACSLVANAGSDVSICSGGSTVLNGSGGGTYSWSPTTGLSNPNIQNPTASPTVTTGYTLTVSNGTCSKTDMVTVIVNPPPVVTMGYAYQKTLTIAPGKVSGGADLVDFPLLVQLTDPDLRYVGNGGRVQSANGYDIAFTDASFNPLKFEIIQYSQATGAYSAWVKVPILSHTANTDIKILYSKSGIAINPSSSETWNPGYLQVMHLDGNFNDATIFQNSGINSGTTSAAGKIQSGRSFDGVNNMITVPDAVSLDGTNDEATISLWINWSNSADGDYQVVMASSNRYTAPNGGFEWASQESGNHYFYPNGSDAANYNLGSDPFTNNTWQYLAVTLNFNSKEVKIYLNGVPISFSTTNVPSRWTSLATMDNWLWGGNPTISTRFFKGLMDEIRVQNVEKSAGWLLTEYTNQNNPATFYSLNTESAFRVLPVSMCANDLPLTLNQARPVGGTYTGTGVSGGAFDPSVAGAGNQTINYTYTDVNGCTGTGSEIIAVNPIPSPVISGNLTVCPNKGGEIYLTPDIAGHSYNWIVTGGTFTGNGTHQITVNWGAGPIGSISLTETINATGCNKIVSSNIDIKDVTPPTITCPANVNVNSDPGFCNANAVVALPVTSDNCGVSSVTNNFNGTANASGTYPVGTTTVIWTVTDNNSNTATCSMTVTVTDTQDPTIACVANQSKTADANQCYYTAVGTEFNPTATSDNCGVLSVINDYNSTNTLAGAQFPVGVTTVIWTVTDIHSRTKTCSFTVTVTDTQDPSITCVANQNRNADANQCYYTAVGTEFNPTATSDNCGVASVTNNFNGLSTLAGAQFPAGVTTVIWTVTDIHARIKTCSFTVTVTDTQDPTITCVANQTKTADANQCYYTAAGTEFNPTSTSDNCSVASVTNNFNGLSTLAGAQFPVGVTTVIWTVTDNHARTNTCSFTITVTDTQDPSITCVANQTKTADSNHCYYTAIGTEFNPASSDNCGVLSVINDFNSTNTLAGAQFPVGVTTVTWTVTDIHSRTKTCSFTVTVSDTQDPSITCIANQNRNADANQCYYTAVGTEFNPTASSDNCGVASVTNNFNGLSTLAGAQFPVGVTTVIWTVTDIHARTKACGFTVTVTDTQDPSITCVTNQNRNADANQCYYTAVGTEFNPTATSDNCGVASVTNNFNGLSTLAGAQFPAGVTTVIWTVTDIHARIKTCSFTVTVTDTQDPSITCVANQNRTADANQCYYMVAGTEFNPTSTSDNCSVASVTNNFNGLSTLAGAHLPVGVTTIVWRVTDAAGRFSTCSFDVTVTDTQIPSITCPADINHTSDPGLCTYSGSPGTPTTADNCSVANVTGTRNDAHLLTDPYPVGVTTIHWVVTDIHGNINSCDQTITVTDDEKPVITCPANINHTADAGLCTYSVSPGTPVTIDNCGVSGVAGTRSDALLLTDPYPVGTTTIHWVVTDIHGLINSCDQTVTITDNEKPVITCPANITHTADAGLCTYSVLPGTPVTGDNCSVASVIGTRSDALTLSDPYPVGLTTIHWLVTDIHGNNNTCDQTITITDSGLPTITCPANVTINCQDDNSPSNTGTATATDNCTLPGNIVITYSDLTTQSIDPSNPLHYNYSISRTWRATDAAGNYNECTQTILVQDITSPAITCPPDKIINCNDDSSPTFTGTPTFTDNCTPAANIEVTYSDVSTQSSDPSVILHYNYTISRTWKGKDVSGNFLECTQTITVHDITNPVITCPANVTLNCDEDNTPAGTGIAAATDVCTPVANIIITHSDMSTYDADPSTLLHYNYTILRTWRATDVAGNFSECIQTITVHDVTKPVITCPGDITLNCEDDNTTVGAGVATATDICTPVGNISITHSDISTYNADPSNVLHYNYSIVRTWRATDIAGNFSECPQKITVRDVTKPLISCPGDLTINCHDDNTPAGTGSATASDICTPVSNITVTFSDLSTYNSDPSSSLHYNYSIIRTWKATDVAGNFEQCSQIITVQDITNPVITCPANITINCDDDITPLVTGNAIVTDNCTPVSNIALTYSDVSTQSADPSDLLHYNYTITRKWKATDVTGNFSECTQTITVHDVTKPEFTVPASITVCRASDCTYDASISITGDVTDESDNCTPGNLLNAVYTDDLSGLLNCDNYGFILRTWTLTDVTGNSTVKVQTIWIEPTPSVSISNNSPIICEGSNVNLVFSSPTLSGVQSALKYVVTVTSTDPTHLGGTASTDFTLLKAGLPYTLAGSLTNSSDAPITVTYSVAPQLNGCSDGLVQTVNVIVNPTPQVIPDKLLQTICNDGTTNVILGSPSTFTSGLITFDYTVVATGGVTGFSTPVNGVSKDYVITDVLHNPTDLPQTVTYTIVPLSPTGCAPGPSKAVVITVDPTPKVVPVPINQTICNNVATNIVLGSPSVFAGGAITFNYTVAATGGVTGFTTPSSGLAKDHVIADVLVNPTDVPQTVTYTITPIGPSGCADGPVSTVSVIVNPTPQVIPSTLTQVVCNDGTTNIVLASPSTFTSGAITLNFTAVATGGVTGFTASGTGEPADFLISDMLHNPTDAPQTVTYTIIPISPTGCTAGPSKTVVVSVDPTPQVVTSAATQKICNDGVTSIVISSPSTFTNGSITFNYTVVATGGVTGFTTPTTGLPENFTLLDFLHNPTDDPQTVTYTIEPVSPFGCASGPTKTVVITVEPTASVIPGPLTQTICNDGTATILLTSPSTFTNGVITFNYSVVATGGVTGFTTPVVNLPNNHTISDILHNPSDAPQTVTYTIVPISPECSATDPVKVVVVIVEPTPQVIPSVLNQSICNGGTTNVILGSASTFTTGIITFNFTATATGGVTGFTPSGTGIPKDYLIADILNNPTDAPQTVTYSITPISPTGCANGPVTTVVVTVNPTPQVVPGTLAETICNDAPVNVALASPSTFDNGAITFSYTVTATGGVSGFTTPVSGLPKDYLINDILHNPTDSPQTVTYTIVPVSPTGCTAGPSKILTIIVNPTPQVAPGTLAQTICNDGITNVLLASPSIFTSGVITFNYTVVATGGVTGFTSSLSGLAKNYVIADILHNPTDAPQTVTYTIIPQSPTGCPAGPAQVVVITVDPTPQVVPDKLSQIICNDSPTSITLGSPSTFDGGVIKFKYTVTATGGVTGFTTPVSGLSKDHIITDLLHNPTDIPQTVTYVIVPVSPAGCADGPSKTVVVIVNPTPQLIPSTLSQTICNGGTTNLILGSQSIFTSGVIKFNYTVTATGGVTGFTTPVNNLPKDYIIADVLQNPTDAPQTVTYTIVPLSPTGCPAGPPKVIIVTVNPTPQVTPSRLLQTICNDGLTNIILGSPSTFSNGQIAFNYTVVATGGVTGFTTPVNGLPKDFVISDILHNPSNDPQTVTYTIVPISPTACSPGPAKVVVVTVNPTPQVVPSTLSQTICNDGTTNVILGSPSTFNNGVIRFNYTVVATGGVTGFTTPVTGLPKDHVIADVLHNPTDAAQTVTYTIVPVSPASCASGPAKVVVITVNPTPRIFPIPANTIQCDSITTNIRLQSPSLFSNGVITFSYTVSSTGSVTGFSTPVSGLPNNRIIADKLVNTSDHFQVVTYTITPVSPSGCASGVPRSVTVTVNPTPRAVPSNLFPSICYTGTANAPVTTEIILTSPTVMTSGSVIFDYTVSTTGGAGVIVGNVSPGVNRPLNYTISNSYQNNSDIIQSVNYLIIPKINNAICVPGKAIVSEVKVHAKPLQSIVVTKPLTCSEGAGLAALKAVISRGADPYHLDWRGSFGYHKIDSVLITHLSSGKYVLNVTDNLGCNNKDSVSILPVTAQATIQAAVIPPGNYNLSCIGSTDGTILVSVAGGITPPYSYTVLKNDADVIANGIFTGNLNLTDPSTFRYLNNLGAGSYTLIIRDANLCENLSRIVLRVPPPIVAPIQTTSFAGGFNISCKGYNDGAAWVVQPVTGGRGTYTYRWYTSDGVIPGAINTDRIDNLVAGTYYLEIKDILGCSMIQSTVITEPDGMKLASYQLSKTPDGNFNISCNGGSDGSISMTVTGGSSNYIFSWTGPNGFGATTKDLTGLKAGVYTCSVRDLNGCVLTPSPTFTLTEPTPLVINSTTYSTSSDGAYNINCFGANTGWVHLSVSGGSIGSYSYNWTTTNGSGIVPGQKDQNALSAGNYQLVVTDLNNCTVIKNITLTQPPEFIIQLAPVNITCKSPGFNNGSINLTVRGGIGPYTYLWSNGAVSEDLANLTPGNYTVTVTDANGCIKTGTATIELPPTLNYSKILSDYNGFNISCNGMSNGFIHVDPTTGSAPFVYSWTGPDGFTSTLKNISDVKAGQYSLLIVDNNECKASEIFNLTEPGKLTINYDLSQSTAGGYNLNCTGDSTGFITVTPLNQVKTVNYLWNDGIFGKTRNNLGAGSYNLIITDANNCHANETITLTEPDSLKIIFNITPPFCPDKPDGKIETSISGGVSGYSYLWSDNSTSGNLSDIPEGKFELVVTDQNACSAKKSTDVQAMNETCLIIPNAISPNGDLINDVWNIGMIELYPLMEVKIFNRWGQPIWRSERGYPRPWDGTNNGSTLPIDSYHYIIDLHNGSKPMVGNVTIVR